MSENEKTGKGLPLAYGEAGLLALLLFLGGVCVYPSNLVTNFLVPEQLSSVAYSRIIGCALLGLCGVRAALALLAAKTDRAPGRTMTLTFALAGCGLIVLYGLIFSYIGFYIATGGFIFALSYYLEAKEDRSARKCIVFTVATIVVISGVFKLFKIYLPPALLF